MAKKYIDTDELIYALFQNVEDLYQNVRGGRMSVLIKGMKMPKSCAACRFRTSYTYTESLYRCYLTGKRLGYYDNKRAKWKTEREGRCPLEEVEDEQPEPRYCDRNICAENEYNGVSCDTCYIAQNYKLEDDDSPCLNCGVGE